jgi:hypothetical protein
MPISEAQKHQVKSWMQDKRVSDTCSACSAAAGWSVSEIVAVSTYRGPTSIGGSNVPMVQVVCSNCGYVMHLSTLAIGIS